MMKGLQATPTYIWTWFSLMRPIRAWGVVGGVGGGGLGCQDDVVIEEEGSKMRVSVTKLLSGNREIGNGRVLCLVWGFFCLSVFVT